MTAQQEDTYGHYSMILEWDPRDAIYVVSVPELPGCRTHGASLEEAVQQGRDALKSWIDVARELGRSVPPPRHFLPHPDDVWVETEEMAIASS